MAKQRVEIPPKVRQAVLNEFNHRCAICGADRPQVHHMDEDPSNNDPANLLPLCPNCHITDQHDPTRRIELRRLQWFRQYRDPVILGDQFFPLYRRLEPLFSVEVSEEPTAAIRAAADELVAFVKALRMGEFYGPKIDDLLRPPARAFAFRLDGGPDPEYERARRRANREHRQQIQERRDEVLALATELLRFQGWSSPEKR